MNEAELKLTLFRWIDQLSGEKLRTLFRVVGKNIEQSGDEQSNSVSDLEAGYAAMAADSDREAEAEEWLEGVLNHESL